MQNTARTTQGTTHSPSSCEQPHGPAPVSSRAQLHRSEAGGSQKISPLHAADRSVPVEMTGERDRLSAAINFSQELSESRLREIARAYRRRWTPAARAEKARLIQRIKPWTRATGPKFRRRAPLDLAINRALREQAAFVRCVNLGFYHAEAGRVILLKLAALLALLEWERIFVTQSDPCCNIAQQ